MLRKLWPNLEREDGLDTVLEVPIPDEMLGTGRSFSGDDDDSKTNSGCVNIMGWMRPHGDRPPAAISRDTDLQLMLGVIGTPLVPLPIQINAFQSSFTRINNDPMEVSTARYIVQQYIAAAGGEKAMGSVSSMYAMGKLRVSPVEFRDCSNRKWGRGGEGEMGGFVLWQKKPDLWGLELVVSGWKIAAGSDGNVAWRQTPWEQHSQTSRGPPRPLRRSLLGLDPMSTAIMFSDSVCAGEKTINGEDCFVLRLDAEAAAPWARSSSSSDVQMIRHTVWGHFSQRRGLLVHLEDSHLLRLKSDSGESVLWENTMESSIEDYRPIDGVNIAHAGRTVVSLFRLGDGAEGRTRARMEESWTVEEVEFNIWGLTADCFLPPGSSVARIRD